VSSPRSARLKQIAEGAINSCPLSFTPPPPASSSLAPVSLVPAVRAPQPHEGGVARVSPRVPDVRSSSDGAYKVVSP